MTIKHLDGEQAEKWAQKTACVEILNAGSFVHFILILVGIVIEIALDINERSSFVSGTGCQVAQ